MKLTFIFLVLLLSINASASSLNIAITPDFDSYTRLKEQGDIENYSLATAKYFKKDTRVLELDLKNAYRNVYIENFFQENADVMKEILNNEDAEEFTIVVSANGYGYNGNKSNYTMSGHVVVTLDDVMIETTNGELLAIDEVFEGFGKDAFLRNIENYFN